MDIPHKGPSGIESQECIIFEIAALSRPSSIPGLMRIAGSQILATVLFLINIALKYFFRRVEPTLYRVVFLAVTPLPLSTVVTILSARCRIPSLFMHARASPEQISVLNRLECLQRLAMDLNSVFAPNPTSFTEPFFRNITHFEFLDSYDDSHPPDNLDAGLGLLPNLTHVAFNPATVTVAAELYTLVRANARLQCLVFFTEKDVMPETTGLWAFTGQIFGWTGSAVRLVTRTTGRLQKTSLLQSALVRLVVLDPGYRQGLEDVNCLKDHHTYSIH
ncbi:hypothetical protein C8R47DRAFT_1102304 [Mycena vitilis]|nr:hypothetical protein C8R47DRAFT_1102304 [Mycena vitilis]